ncbi:hypothetical protein Tco_0875695 [Tanacetum coccineum]|uniref:Uncharacterized protein n=1 Tax=Tanacetum coccineum TaxID=301880 RepID=A0ABQ5BVU5_9ASTR
MSSKDAEEESSDNRDHVHFTEEQIKEQNRIEESTKVEAAKHDVEVRKEELVYLLAPVREKSRIINCDVLTKKGPISLKVYREDGTSEVIPNFKASDYTWAKGEK